MGDLIKKTRIQELELPKKVEVGFFNRNKDYEDGLQRAIRQVTDSSNIFDMRVPLAFTNSQAKQIAEKIMAVTWVERNLFEFRLTSTYLYLEPTDTVQFTHEGVTYTARVVNVTYRLPNIIHVQAVAESAAAYTVYASSDDTDDGTYGVSVVPYTQALLLDLPPLNDAHDNFGFYTAFAGYTSTGWDGCLLFDSNDGGVSFNYLNVYTDPAFIGTLTSTLDPPIRSTVLDRDNKIQVTQFGGADNAPTSDTFENVFNGANGAAVGNVNTGWELIQFASVAQISGGYEISTLMRGRYGTEWMMDQHTAGDVFVLLNTTDIDRLTQNVELLNTERYYKAPSITHTLEETPSFTFTNTGVSLKPFSPVHIESTRSYASAGVQLDWKRRNRILFGWNQNADIPMSEDAEQYEIDFITGVSTVVTTIATTAQEYFVTSAFQENAYGTPQSNITVEIFQMSSTIGRGYVARASGL